MRNYLGTVLSWSWLIVSATAIHGAHPHAADRITSLTNADVKYEPVEAGAVRMQRGAIELVLVDNQAHQLPEAPNHRAGYNGVAILKHQRQPRTLFVPEVAGLNFEHIHDGIQANLVEKFEPRVFPMQMRRIDEFTCELYQAPTKNFQLESCGRYQLLEDGTIQYTFECIPRADRFKQGFIGLFWASYIHQPLDKSIFFLGHKRSENGNGEWINGITPQHGVNATHPPANALFQPKVQSEFQLTLVRNASPYVHTSHWYYAVCRGMAFVQVFRPRDRIWLAQSPSGGGRDNPAWDFQWFVNEYQVGQAYGFTMRAAYVPFESREQIEKLATRMQQELATADPLKATR